MKFSKVLAYIQITRPEIAVMDISLPAVCALLATFSTQGAFPPMLPFVGAILGAYFCVIASYVVNDTLDIDIDTINLPHRALPSGKLSRKEALFFASILYLLGIAIYAVFSLKAVLVVFAAIVIITFYSAYFKRKTPLSFIFVGLAYGLVPLMSWLIITDVVTSPCIFFAAMICITDWGFTLSGVARDVSGDREKGAPTLPVTWGIKKTAIFIFICWLVGVGLSITIGITANMGWFYLSVASVSGLWLLWRCIHFIIHPEPEIGGKLFLESSGYRGVVFLALMGEMAFNARLI